MNPSQFRKVLRTTVTIPLLLLAILAAVLMGEVTYAKGVRAKLDRTSGAIADAELLMRLIVDMESGLRGFLLTGNDIFLEHYQLAESGVPSMLASLEQKVDVPEDRARLLELSTKFNEWHSYSKTMIDRRRQGGDASDTAENLRGKEMLDPIRAEWGRLLANQERQRNGLAAKVRFNSKLVLLSVGILSLLFGAIIAFVTHKRIVLLTENYERHLQRERGQAEEAIRNRQWLLTTLKSMGEGVVATDSLGRVQFMNPVAEQLTGWKQEQASGVDFLTVFQALDANTRAPLTHLLDAASRNPQQAAVRNHTLLRSRNGQESFVEHSASDILDEQGSPCGAVMVFRDVTQRKRSDEALRSSEKLALIGRLSATIAHEIRNPLDAVANLLYLLRRTKGLDSESVGFINLAEEELARVAQITKQLLSFNREARQPVEVDLADIVESALALFRPKLDAMRLKIFTNLEDRPKVIGLPGELRQVVSNLIANSIEASQQDGLLTVRLKRSYDWQFDRRPGVRIFVCDTGSGIPVDARENLFQPFFTTKGERGTGLGLWVSRGIIEKHGGNMKFRTSTDPGHSGTCFNIFLPYEPNMPAAMNEVA